MANLIRSVVVGVFVFPFSVLAAEMTPTEIYAKCFARLTNHPVNIDSTTYRNVAEGTADPVRSCMKLFNRAALVTDGAGNRLLNNEKDGVALGIVENFQRFHQSWFSNIGNYGGGPELSLYSYVDYSAPALYITEALLAKRNYRSVFTRNDAIEGVRRKPATLFYSLARVNMESRQIISGPLTGGNNTTNVDNVDVVKFARINQGQLVGLRNSPPKRIKNRAAYYTETLPENQYGKTRDEQPLENINRYFGGGILGSPSYIMLNSESNGTLDGGVRIHRRLANTMLYDLMCLNMPSLNDDQVGEYLNKYKESGLSFRVDKSCARCHATLDPLADTFRNIQVVTSSNNTFRINFLAKAHEGLERPALLRYLKEYKVRVTGQVVSDTDPLYRRREPVGRLYYNSINGKTVDQKVRGVADLGIKMANQLDPYVCAASRYYGFLTGVNISLHSGESSDFYKKHRRQVISLGKELKKDGSLQKMVERILNSEAFQSHFPGQGEMEGFVHGSVERGL